mgnify:CR=1 FL=1
MLFLLDSAAQLALIEATAPAQPHEVLLELALKNLERINFVGLTDRLEKFADIVSFNLGFYNSYSEERLNVMPKQAKIDAADGWTERCDEIEWQFYP